MSAKCIKGNSTLKHLQYQLHIGRESESGPQAENNKYALQLFYFCYKTIKIFNICDMLKCGSKAEESHKVSKPPQTTWPGQTITAEMSKVWNFFQVYKQNYTLSSLSLGDCGLM